MSIINNASSAYIHSPEVRKLKDGDPFSFGAVEMVLFLLTTFSNLLSTETTKELHGLLQINYRSFSSALLLNLVSVVR